MHIHGSINKHKMVKSWLDKILPKSDEQLVNVSYDHSYAIPQAHKQKDTDSWFLLTIPALREVG